MDVHLERKLERHLVKYLEQLLDVRSVRWLEEATVFHLAVLSVTYLVGLWEPVMVSERERCWAEQLEPQKDRRWE
jgi:hypothetical protein